MLDACLLEQSVGFDRMRSFVLGSPSHPSPEFFASKDQAGPLAEMGLLLRSGPSFILRCQPKRPLRASIRFFQRCVEIAMEVDDRALEVTEGEELVRSAPHAALNALYELAVLWGTRLVHELRVALG